MTTPAYNGSRLRPVVQVIVTELYGRGLPTATWSVYCYPDDALDVCKRIWGLAMAKIHLYWDEAPGEPDGPSFWYYDPSRDMS